MVQLLCGMLNHQRNPAEVKTAQVSSCGILAAFLRNCVSATFHLLTKEGPQIIMTAFEIINITFPLPSALPQWSNPIPSTKYGNDFPFIDHSRLSQPSSAFRFSLALIWLSLSSWSLRRAKVPPLWLLQENSSGRSSFNAAYLPVEYSSVNPQNAETLNSELLFHTWDLNSTDVILFPKT